LKTLDCLKLYHNVKTNYVGINKYIFSKENIENIKKSIQRIGDILK